MTEISGNQHRPVRLDVEVEVLHRCAGSELWARVYLLLLGQNEGHATAATRANAALRAFNARNEQNNAEESE